MVLQRAQKFLKDGLAVFRRKISATKYGIRDRVRLQIAAQIWRELSWILCGPLCHPPIPNERRIVLESPICPS